MSNHSTDTKKNTTIFMLRFFQKNTLAPFEKTDFTVSSLQTRKPMFNAVYQKPLVKKTQPLSLSITFP